MSVLNLDGVGHDLAGIWKLVLDILLGVWRST